MRLEKWGDMHFELMCNLMCGFDSCCLYPIWLSELYWMKKIKFLKYHDILSIFKRIIWKLEIVENQSIWGILLE